MMTNKKQAEMRRRFDSGPSHGFALNNNQSTMLSDVEGGLIKRVQIAGTSAGLVVAVGLFALCFTAEVARSATQEPKLVTRIETVTAKAKHGRLVLSVVGMAHTGRTLLPKGGRLVRHGPDFQPNKEGLLEYDLQFVPPQGEPPEKLHEVKAALTERSIPAGAKGVRVFGEFNYVDSIFSEGKKKE